MATITGIVIKGFPKSGTQIAELSVLRPVENVSAEKFNQHGIGFNTDIPYNKQPLKVSLDYAKQLIETRAFLPNRDYEIKFGSNPDDPLEVLVTQIVPVDEDVKKYMAQQLDSKVSK
ncbi:DUF1293 domain-containing protein [Vibrio vulnificus]|nr:DUF1293 domain-containing protein [Vibrio vulnificus]